MRHVREIPAEIIERESHGVILRAERKVPRGVEDALQRRFEVDGGLQPGGRRRDEDTDGGGMARGAGERVVVHYWLAAARDVDRCGVAVLGGHVPAVFGEGVGAEVGVWDGGNGAVAVFAVAAFAVGDWGSVGGVSGVSGVFMAASSAHGCC